MTQPNMSELDRFFAQVNTSLQHVNEAGAAGQQAFKNFGGVNRVRTDLLSARTNFENATKATKTAGEDLRKKQQALETDFNKRRSELENEYVNKLNAIQEQNDTVSRTLTEVATFMSGLDTKLVNAVQTRLTEAQEATREATLREIEHKMVKAASTAATAATEKVMTEMSTKLAALTPTAVAAVLLPDVKKELKPVTDQVSSLVDHVKQTITPTAIGDILKPTLLSTTISLTDTRAKFEKMNDFLQTEIKNSVSGLAFKAAVTSAIDEYLQPIRQMTAESVASVISSKLQDHVQRSIDTAMTKVETTTSTTMSNIHNSANEMIGRVDTLHAAVSSQSIANSLLPGLTQHLPVNAISAAIATALTQGLHTHLTAVISPIVQNVSSDVSTSLKNSVTSADVGREILTGLTVLLSPQGIADLITGSLTRDLKRDVMIQLGGSLATGIATISNNVINNLKPKDIATALTPQLVKRMSVEAISDEIARKLARSLLSAMTNQTMTENIGGEIAKSLAKYKWHGDVDLVNGIAQYMAEAVTKVLFETPGGTNNKLFIDDLTSRIASRLDTAQFATTLMTWKDNNNQTVVSLIVAGIKDALPMDQLARHLVDVDLGGGSNFLDRLSQGVAGAMDLSQLASNIVFTEGTSGTTRIRVLAYDLAAYLRTGKSNGMTFADMIGRHMSTGEYLMALAMAMLTTTFDNGKTLMSVTGTAVAEGLNITSLSQGIVQRMKMSDLGQAVVTGLLSAVFRDNRSFAQEIGHGISPVTPSIDYTVLSTNIATAVDGNSQPLPVAIAQAFALELFKPQSASQRSWTEGLAGSIVQQAMQDGADVVNLPEYLVRRILRQLIDIIMPDGDRLSEAVVAQIGTFILQAPIFDGDESFPAATVRLIVEALQNMIRRSGGNDGGEGSDDDGDSDDGGSRGGDNDRGGRHRDRALEDDPARQPGTGSSQGSPRRRSLRPRGPRGGLSQSHRSATGEQSVEPEDDSIGLHGLRLTNTPEGGRPGTNPAGMGPPPIPPAGQRSSPFPGHQGFTESSNRPTTPGSSSAADDPHGRLEETTPRGDHKRAKHESTGLPSKPSGDTDEKTFRDYRQIKLRISDLVALANSKLLDEASKETIRDLNEAKRQMSANTDLPGCVMARHPGRQKTANLKSHRKGPYSDHSTPCGYCRGRSRAAPVQCFNFTDDLAHIILRYAHTAEAAELLRTCGEQFEEI